MLLKPGTEAHDYEPSPKDITKISSQHEFTKQHSKTKKQNFGQ